MIFSENRYPLFGIMLQNYRAESSTLAGRLTPEDTGLKRTVSDAAKEKARIAAGFFVFTNRGIRRRQG
jgi:hypothetical protein